jgi:hypothetical protein
MYMEGGWGRGGIDMQRGNDRRGNEAVVMRPDSMYIIGTQM